MTLYGTPQTVALNQRLEEDHIPTTSPGFGISAAADGTRYPYLFPIAATYWSQGAAAVKYVKDKLGDLHGKKIAYVYYDNPAGKEPIAIIEALHKKDGKEPPKEMDDTVIYNRGLLQAAVHVEALKNALKQTGGKPPKGEDVKKGFEGIKELNLGGLVPPLTITPTEHEGGGWVQIFQVKGGKFVKETEWVQAYREVVEDAVKHAE